MKRYFILAIMAVSMLCGTLQADNVQEARSVIRRAVGHFPKNIVLKSVARNGDTDQYAFYVQKGILHVEGSSAVAICRGFYDYVSQNGYGVYNWSGSRFDFPKRFPDTARHEVRSPFKHRLYMNVCTFGYTTPFWDWERWEREIDWMALHGFDMPLAPIANEAIFARVWREMGLTEKEINVLFTGPAHLPWMRMGNMSGVDGAPTQAWHNSQIALQHKILKRMRNLGMKPVCQGFAGFVPPAMKAHFPDINLTETKWSGMKNWMLSPLDDLFVEIGNRYIKAWEKEFGKSAYYLIDSFNELDVPFGKKGSKERFETLQKYGKTIYRSLSQANPDAVWVMQGWMFGYQRNVWDPESARALLSGAPEGKMMILDLAVDFNQYIWRTEKSWDYLSGMFNREWIYSTVPNFGGRTALIGNMEFYANGHLNALRSANRGQLTGYGTSPEGVENNDILYEIIAAAGWSDREIDVPDFLHRYSQARYGKAPAEMMRFWEEMRKSSYNEMSNNARFRWQVRPGYHRMPTMGINEHYYRAIEHFFACADELQDSKLYRTDAIQYAAFYLVAKADLVLEAIHWAYLQNRDEDARKLEAQFLHLLKDADRLLASHPLFRLEHWTDQAMKAGCTPEEKERQVSELHRLMTIWGTGESLNDYAARIWSGLIRDFYIPRWENYFAALHGSRSFDFVKWDATFYPKRERSTVTPFSEPLKEAKRLVEEAGKLTSRIVAAPTAAVSYWTPMDFLKEKTSYSFTIGHDTYERLKAIRLNMTRGTDPLMVERITFRSNHRTWAEAKPQATLDSVNRMLEIKPDKQEGIEVPLAKEVTVTIYLQGKPAADSFGAVEVVFE